jgi:hypothetical protein
MLNMEHNFIYLLNSEDSVNKEVNGLISLFQEGKTVSNNKSVINNKYIK